VCRIDGGTDATPVAYLLEDPPQSRSGEISLPVRRFVAQAGKYLERDLGGYSLMGSSFEASLTSTPGVPL
jgi:hypothetical protein